MRHDIDRARKRLMDIDPNALRDMHLWREGKLFGFRADLFQLIEKATPRQRMKLKLSFPDEYHSWSTWESSGDVQFKLLCRTLRII